MKRRLVLVVVVFITLISCFYGTSDGAASTYSRKVCGSVAPGYARCNATILIDGSSASPLTGGPTKGYGPADFRAAYGVSGSTANHVAVVVAFDAPNIQPDLAVFSKAFGLPILPSCTSASQASCFEKINQRGSNNLPAANSDWAVEASLDVESIHGMCPHCRISLVEASSSSINNLSTAAETAANLGARVVSNSYGGSEMASESTYDERYHHTGVAMVASSGDNGYGTVYPAASPFVIAVGGTSLRMTNGVVSSEQAWPGSGSGCSHYEAKPAWQHDSRCQARSIADISADADPATGAAIYDSYPAHGRSGWTTVGGTSLSAPLVAGIIASSGLTSNQPAVLYNTPNFIRDIIGGANGSCRYYFCRSLSGYDGPTGLGVLSHL